MNLRNVLMFSLAFVLTVPFVYAERRAKPVVCAASKEYIVGDKGPSGGWIIYKKPKATATGQTVDTCWQYLEAAKEDIKGAKFWSYKDAGNTDDYKVVGTTGIEIGDGKENTKKIIQAGYNKENAASACDAYNPDGKTKGQWFLPSRNELELIYQTLCKGKNNKCNFNQKKNQQVYWSSSEVDEKENRPGGVWARFFIMDDSTHDSYIDEHYHENNVRCIHAI